MTTLTLPVFEITQTNKGYTTPETTGIKKAKITSSQDGGVGRHSASLHNQKKDNQFKNKKQPEMPESQTVWKSNNQGVKEETLIQTCRRGRDGQWGWRGLTAWWRLEDWVRRRLVEPVVQQMRVDKP